jgi:hypothetical protein
MATKAKVPVTTQKNLFLLWLYIYGGDPGPEDDGPVGQLTNVLSMHEMARQLSDVTLRRELQAVTSKAIARLSQQVAKG